MSKVEWKPGTLVYPVPAALISCGSKENTQNLITISWTGTVNTNPPMLYISIRPERHSYDIIKNEMEFVLNLTTKDMAFATDWCGVKSGKDVNKFKEVNLHPIPASIVKCPMVKEAPINIECKVKQIVPLGSHDMLIAEIVKIHADEKFIDKETDTFDMQKAKLIAYSHGFYYELGNKIGKFGFSVKKKKRNERVRKKKKNQ